MFRVMLAAAVFVAALAPSAWAKTAIYQKKNLAVSGYDPVAYFSLDAADQAVKGEEAFSYDYLGATWRFASQANLDLFKADPEAYAPQYGGYCAYAISARGKLVKTDPNDWKIHNGKLYLNFSATLRKKWEDDPESFIPAGDANWASVLPTLELEKVASTE